MGVMQVSGWWLTLGMSREPRMGQTESWLRPTVGRRNEDPYLTLYCMALFPQTRLAESADRDAQQTVKLCKVQVSLNGYTLVKLDRHPYVTHGGGTFLLHSGLRQGSD